MLGSCWRQGTAHATAVALLAVLASPACVPDYSPDVLLTFDAGARDAARPARADTGRPTPIEGDDPDEGGDPADDPLDDSLREPRDEPSREGDSGIQGPRPSDPSDAGPVAADASAEPIDPTCDLRGRWLITERLVTNALGSRQVVHSWYLYELAQSGTALTVSTGLACGTAAIGLPPIEVNGDMSKMFPTMLERVQVTGRRGSAQSRGSGCRVAFDKIFVIYGASVPFYLDPKRPLPTADEPAHEDQPGWEDWDNDNKPGISIVLRGAISGSMFSAIRTWTQYAGAAESVLSSFVLPIDWNQEKSTLGFDGSPLLDINGVRDGDDSQHYVEFARLSSTQAVGDPAAQCADVRKLAPMLTPNAMK